MSYCHVCKKKIGFFESLAFHGKCYACSSKAHTKFTERKKEKSQKEVIEKNSEERVDLTKLVFKIVVLFLLAFILSAISQTPCLFSLLINFIVLGLLYWAYIKFMKPRFEKPITSKHIKIIDPERIQRKVMLILKIMID